MPDDPTPRGSQDHVHRLLDGHIIRSHVPKPLSPPSLKHDHHEIEETDLFSIMSSKESTAARSSVFSKQHAHYEQSTSRSTTPDAHDQEHPVQTRDQLFEHMDFSSGIPLHPLPSDPGLVRHSSQQRLSSSNAAAACNITDDAEISEDSSDTGTDHDLDLEGEVDRALSEWYGIRLKELPRPFRIVHLFEEVKDKCAEILEDEGFGLYLDQNDTPTPTEDEQSAQDGSGGNSASKYNQRLSSAPGKSSAAQKRKSGHMGGDDEEDDPMDPSESREREPNRTRGPNKRQRDPQHFSCPYRKRNPLRFSVSNFETCAIRSFEDISTLKKHCHNYHYTKKKKPMFPCRKCRRSFASLELFAEHIEGGHASSPTEHTQTDPEDGFGEEVYKRLRSKRHADKVNTWEVLWRALFGDQDPVPSSEFEPVYEHHEVAERLSSQCHTWADQFFPIISTWATRPEYDAWALNMNLMRAFGMVLSPVLKSSKALSLEGMTRRRTHHMWSLGKTQEECDTALLEGISSDRHFERYSSKDLSRALAEFGSSGYSQPIDRPNETGGVFEGHVQQQDVPMPDPALIQPWSDLGGDDRMLAGVFGLPNERNTAAGHDTMDFASYGGTFDMNMIDHTGGMASIAGPSNVQKGYMGQNRGRGW